MLAAHPETDKDIVRVAVSFNFQVCLWSGVSVTANLTQTIPQVSVTAQEMLPPPTRV